jgi:ribonuclease HI
VAGLAAVTLTGKVLYGRVPGMQSIRRAEALAILAALMLARLDTNLVVVSDSKCDVVRCTRMCATAPTSKAWSTMAHTSIYRNIFAVISERSGTTALRHVRSHRSINTDDGLVNHIADGWAKRAVSDSRQIAIQERVAFLGPAILLVDGAIVEADHGAAIKRAIAVPRCDAFSRLPRAARFNPRVCWMAPALQLFDDRMVSAGMVNFAAKTRTRSLPTFVEMQRRHPVRFRFLPRLRPHR